jgi:hypothetical protein
VFVSFGFRDGLTSKETSANTKSYFNEFSPAPFSPSFLFFSNVYRLSLESRYENSIFVQVHEASLRAHDCLIINAVLQLAWFPPYGNSDRKGIVTSTIFDMGHVNLK